MEDFFRAFAIVILHDGNAANKLVPGKDLAFRH
jgi:hypothetical protein